MSAKKVGFGWKSLVLILLAVAMCFASFAFAACGEPDEPSGKEVKSIAVTKTPTKTEYKVGETFSAEGGEITVTYTDGSTEVVKMTDKSVTIQEVNIALDDDVTEGKIVVRLSYGGKNTNFEITVSANTISVTFDWNYEGDTDVVRQINAGETVRAPGENETPERDGFTFVGWYADTNFTAPYDFSAGISEETTIYAFWTDDSKTYYEVTFDNNYTGAPEAVVQLIESGKTAVRPMNDPLARTGYTFDGWFADAGAETEFDFSAVITADTVVYAGWTREASDEAVEYVFEAENTDLTGKNYPGLSGSAPEKAMVQNFTTNIRGEELNASGGRYIGYQTTIGANITFRIVSDMEVDDAKIVLRLSKELGDYTFTPDNYTVELNADPLQFEPIAFTDVPSQAAADDVKNCYALPFDDFVIAENVHLKEGVNTINCIVLNSDPIAGTTIESNGPLIDCIKITTTAVLDWSAADGLPKDNT